MENCERCCGEGKIITRKIILYETCPECKGDKYFNWVEKVMGKNTLSAEIYNRNDIISNLRYLQNELEQYGRNNGFNIKTEIDVLDLSYQQYNDIIKRNLLKRYPY